MVVNQEKMKPESDCGHCTGQPVTAGTSSYEPEDFSLKQSFTAVCPC